MWIYNYIKKTAVYWLPSPELPSTFKKHSGDEQTKDYRFIYLHKRAWYYLWKNRFTSRRLEGVIVMLSLPYRRLSFLSSFLVHFPLILPYFDVSPCVCFPLYSLKSLFLFFLASLFWACFLLSLFLHCLYFLSIFFSTYFLVFSPLPS